MMNPIETQHSWYSGHPKRSIGQILHYIDVICGLKYAAVCTVGNGEVCYHEKFFAQFVYDQDDCPKFIFEDELWNDRQNTLIKRLDTEPLTV